MGLVVTCYKRRTFLLMDTPEEDVLEAEQETTATRKRARETKTKKAKVKTHLSWTVEKKVETYCLVFALNLAQIVEE